MSDPHVTALNSWLVEPLPRDVASSIQRLRRQEDITRVAVMPDVHLGKDVCIGVAVATRQLIYPAAIGGDIGCGMAAVAVHVDVSALVDERFAGRILEGLRVAVPTNKHPQLRALPDKLQRLPLSDPALVRHAQRDGRVQFGTLGRGNHFLEFQVDTNGQLWIMVHSGSRAMGQWITKHHTRTPATSNRLLALDSLEDPGRSYLADVAWARRYAAENRRAMLEAVEALLALEFKWSIDWRTLIHGDHNHVQREVHDEEQQWVHRKGAQAVPIGTAGLVPGSMGTPSFHVVGRGHATALHSCAHGAGRQVARGAAVRTVAPRTFAQDMRGVWFDTRKTMRLLDEAPSVYKDIRAVMRAQRELVRITRELRPVLSYKGV